MPDLSEPYIFKTSYSNSGNATIDKDIEENFGVESKYLINYPTVYIVNDNDKKDNYSVYVGETNDIKQRTNQHLNVDPRYRDDWKELSENNDATMYVIGHNYFNKSLTLDIENRMMLYLSSVENVKAIYNRRTNEQREYYTSEQMEGIFSKIWEKLRNENKTLFPSEEEVRDKAIFKASPFHKLTEEQIDGKNKIMAKITESLTNENKEHQLILVEGAAGTGKTVLISSIFYDLYQQKYNYAEDDLPMFKNLSVYLLVNHNEQVTVYKDIARKLKILEREGDKIVSKPTTFINNNEPGEDIDVVLIDEAHLLWTQGKQSYRGKDHLTDILERAKVVIAIYDLNQVLTTTAYIDEYDYMQKRHEANFNNNLIVLENQMRINASKETNEWIADFSRHNTLGNIPEDNQGYEVKVFDTPDGLFKAIEEKSENEETALSRLVASYDWEYNANKPDDEEFWNVEIGDFKMPWNYQVAEVPEEKALNKNRAWAEKSHTIDEIGSTFTIQGFDLNYVGVIIGPSVQYRDGKIVFDKSKSHNKSATQRRTLADGTKKEFSDVFLKNELNVLLTRGVNGLYIYAVDEALQEALQKSVRGEL